MNADASAGIAFALFVLAFAFFIHWTSHRQRFKEWKAQKPDLTWEEYWKEVERESNDDGPQMG